MGDPGQRRRVLYLIEQFRVGGLERVVLAQVHGLLERGVDVAVALLEAEYGNPLIAELDPRAELIELPKGPIARVWALGRLAADRIVVIHFGKGKLYPALRPALIRADRVVRFCHSDYAHCRRLWMNALDRMVARSDALIVAVGGRSADFMTRDVGVPGGKVKTLPNVLPPIGVAERRGHQAGPCEDTAGPLAHQPRLCLIAVADLAPHKGQDVVLRGLAHLLREVPAAELTLIGDGTEAVRLWRLARDLGVLGRVRWLGAVWPAEIVRDRLKQSNLFVSMSRAEGIPISVLEARRSGLPMVLSDIPGHRDSAASAAEFVPVDDDRAFADAVLRSYARQAISAATLPEARAAAPAPSDSHGRHDWHHYLDDLQCLLETEP